MSNNLLTTLAITRESIRLFINSNLFIKNIDRQYDNQFARDGAKIGATLRIRLPNDYTVSDGPALSLQDTNEQQTPLVVATQRHVDTAFTSADKTLSLDDFGQRVLLPKTNVLAGNVAATVIGSIGESACNAVANVTGGNVILSPNQQTYLQAGAMLDDNSTPMMGTIGDRKVASDPWTDANVVSTLTGLYNPQQQIGDQYRSGTMKQGLGFSWFRDQTMIKHTTGNFSAGGLVSQAGYNGTALPVSATTGTLLIGDLITIPAVNAVNRVTKVSTGKLRQFVVTANVPNGGTVVNIYPAIVSPVGGQPVQYQTVDAAPALNAPIALVFNASSVYRKSLAYAPEAITMVTADLVLPKKGIVEGARDAMDGVSMRMITAYLPGTDQLADRLDVLFGYLAIRPEWMCVVPDVI